MPFANQSAPGAALGGLSLKKLLKKASKHTDVVVAGVNAATGQGSWLDVARRLLPGAQNLPSMQPPPPPVPESSKPWLVPVVVAGGVLVVVGLFAVMRKGGRRGRR